MNSQQNRIIALLPMKANSTRVKGKNFRDLCGKPLFRWTLDTLLEVDAIDLVVINTDAREILKNHGLTATSRIHIRDRRPSICGDTVSMNSVIADDVENCDSTFYIMTHTTNPFLKKETIERSLAVFKECLNNNKCDSLFSVNRFQSRFYRGDGTPINHDPSKLIPTQDLDPWYEENSNLYIFTRESFKKTSARIGSRPILFEQDLLESVDIDTEDDWRRAEVISKYLNDINRISK